MKGRDSLDDPDISSSRCPLEGFYASFQICLHIISRSTAVSLQRVPQSLLGTQVMLVSKLVVVRSDVTSIELYERYGVNDRMIACSTYSLFNIRKTSAFHRCTSLQSFPLH